MLAGLLALTAAAVFTGAAFYVLFVEQPARLTLNDSAALSEFQPSYRKGAVMQASLAVIACLLGLVAYWQSGNVLFAAGAIFQILPWPWTLLVIMPTNKRLLATAPVHADAASTALIRKWGMLHGVRALLGLMAVIAYLWALLATTT